MQAYGMSHVLAVLLKLILRVALARPPATTLTAAQHTQKLAATHTEVMTGDSHQTGKPEFKV